MDIQLSLFVTSISIVSPMLKCLSQKCVLSTSQNKHFFLKVSPLALNHTSSLLQPMPAIDPLSFLLLADLNVLLDVDSWRGRDRHSWKQKGRRYSQPRQDAGGGGKAKQGGTKQDTHQWMMERHDGEATTLHDTRTITKDEWQVRNVFKQMQQTLWHVA